MYVDFHNHLLPFIDDGANSEQESADMINLLFLQNVRRIVFTPHYEQKESPFSFVRKRKEAFLSIKQYIPKKLSIQLAAEISLEKGITENVDLSLLSPKKSGYIFVALPVFAFEPWIDEEIHNILYKQKLFPVFTSMERYAITYPPDIYSKILRTPNAAFQFNNKSFLLNHNIETVKKLLSLNKNVLLGSDAHNSATRQPNFDILTDTLQPKIDKIQYNYLLLQNKKFIKPV